MNLVRAQQLDTPETLKDCRTRIEARKKAEAEEQRRLVAKRKVKAEAVLAKIRGKSLCLAGTNTARSTLEKLYREFHQKNPDTPQKLFYEGGGTEVGFREILVGHAEAALVRRKLTDKEKKQLAKAYPNPKRQPTEAVFSKSAMVIIVHKSNRISSFTYQQIEDIYRGKVTDWSEVSSRKAKIERIGTTYPALSWGMFTRQILKGKRVRFPEEKKPRVRRKRTRDDIIRERRERHQRFPGGGAFPRYIQDGKVIQEVAKKPNAIGYCILSPGEFKTKGVRIVPIIPEGKTEAIEPTRENVLFDKYPLQLTIKFLIRPGASQVARDFIKFVCSEEVAEMVRQCGLHPVSEKEQILIKRRLAAMKAGKGPKVRVVGAKGCGKLLDGLAVDYVMATAVIQMKYSGGEERAAVGRFATAGAKAAAGEKVSANSPQLLVLDGAMSEKTRDAYREKLAAAKPVRHVLGARGVAVIVNPKNPLKSITAEQVVEVFRGKAKSWADVAGAGQTGKTAGGKTAKGGKTAGGKNTKNNKNDKNSQIVRYSPDPTKDAAVKYFHREILQANRCRGVQYRKTADSVIGFVASNPGGIGVIDVNDLAKTAAQTGVKVLAIGPAGKAALPTSKNLLAGKYPLARQVIMYVSPNADEATKDFVKFILTAEPSETFAKAGLVTAHSKITMPKPKPAKKKSAKGKAGKDKKSGKKDDKNKNLPKWKKDKEKSKAPGGW
ncbi:MAG: substrate-binding domain-containing protein [Phycisphaerae bacterium]|nr:substrate-binding domain-containing protein [Phycisphaerae bacterium]